MISVFVLLQYRSLVGASLALGILQLILPSAVGKVEHGSIMSRLEELEKDELSKAAESDGDEDELTKAGLHRKKDEVCILEMQSAGLTEEPVTKGEISHSQIIQQDTKTSSPSINASAPFEKVSLKQNHHNEIRLLRFERGEKSSSNGFILPVYIFPQPLLSFNDERLSFCTIGV
ncbi:hypothetical protein Gotri_027547 [Gossypium trilobum]|uniref:Uncharacterized protein n=1 Tax=Gossypium trilobum TaxID=34281 RepID=A0A7J9FQ85_9ROSI|nr:hypothetical protein [Gossypium trilobum]